MPYTLRKIPRKNCYRVYNKDTKRVFAKCSTKTHAQMQLRLLRSLPSRERRQRY